MVCDSITTHNSITPWVILPVVQLVHMHSLGLLPAMICRIQSGPRMLTEQFYGRTTSKRVGSELVFPQDRPSPRVELSYAYLITWFALHCLVLIQSGEEPS